MRDLVNYENATIQEQREYNRKLFALYYTLLGPLNALENLYLLKKNKKDEIQKTKAIGIGLLVFYLFISFLFYGFAIGLFESIRSYEVRKMMGSLVFLTVFCGLIILNSRKRKKKRTKIENEIVSLDKQINQVYEEHVEEFQFIPQSYFCTDAVDYFVRAYKDGKVSNLKEAMESYDLYSHRRKMENNQQQIMLQQQQLLQNQKAMRSEMTFDTAMLILSRF